MNSFFSIDRINPKFLQNISNYDIIKNNNSNFHFIEQNMDNELLEKIKYLLYNIIFEKKHDTKIFLQIKSNCDFFDFDYYYQRVIVHSDVDNAYGYPNNFILFLVVLYIHSIENNVKKNNLKLLQNSNKIYFLENKMNTMFVKFEKIDTLEIQFYELKNKFVSLGKINSLEILFNNLKYEFIKLKDTIIPFESLQNKINNLENKIIYLNNVFFYFMIAGFFLCIYYFI
jgi:hypothetical protein